MANENLSSKQGPAQAAGSGSDADPRRSDPASNATGRKRGPYKKRGQETPSVPPPPKVDLFNAENSSRIVALPFKLAALRTDDPNFELSPAEATELGASFAVCANEWLPIAPAYVSLVLFSVSLVGIVSTKLAVHSAWKAEMKRQEAERAQAKVPPPNVPKP